MLIGISSNENRDCYEGLFEALKRWAPLWYPSAIMSDGASYITAAISEKFPSAHRLMCYFHMSYNVKKYFGKKESRKFIRVRNMLRLVQLANCWNEFQNLLHCMFSELGEDFAEFQHWFTRYSTGSLANWFEGFGFVSTNNGLESTNNVIKNENTERVMHTVSSFLPIMNEIASDWTIHSESWTFQAHFGQTTYAVGYQYYLYFKQANFHFRLCFLPVA